MPRRSKFLLLKIIRGDAYALGVDVLMDEHVIVGDSSDFQSGLKKRIREKLVISLLQDLQDTGESS
jgi:hypothetical protein